MSSPLSLKKRIGYILVGLCGLGIVCVSILEAGVRIFQPQQENMRWLTPHDRYGHVMKANYHEAYPFIGTDYVMDVQTNSQGFRDAEASAAKPPQKTVVFSGDSFTFGYGVDVRDRFDSVLARRLEKSDDDLRFINLGVPAWGTIQATRYLSDHFEEYRPDVVVITFCSNDLSDDAYFRKKGKSFDAIYFPGKRFLRNHSHLFRLVNRRAFVLLHTYYIRQAQRENPGATMDEQSGSLVIDSRWRSTFQVLDDFKDAFLAFNPKGEILIQATSPLHKEIRAQLSAYGDTDHVVYVDLHDAASNFPLDEKRLPFDGHWSPLMHSLSGQALQEALATLDL